MMKLSRPDPRRLIIQVDAIVSSVNRMGVFADVGPLPVFISNHVSHLTRCEGDFTHETEFF